jgi:hypothetical protein
VTATIAPPSLRTLVVRRWDDDVVDSHPQAMSARSVAAETYWLPIIGPTTLLCARRLVSWLDAEETVVVGLDVLAAMLGVGLRSLADAGGRMGRSAPLPSALRRLCHYGLAHRSDTSPDLWVRRIWAPLTEAQVRRLPESLALTYRAGAA